MLHRAKDGIRELALENIGEQYGRCQEEFILQNPREALFEKKGFVAVSARDPRLRWSVNFLFASRRVLFPYVRGPNDSRSLGDARRSATGTAAAPMSRSTM